MNAIPAEGWTPRRIRRRATGTEPHSHTGIAKPASAAAGTCTGVGSWARRAKARAGTNTAIAAEAAAPIRMNGRASTTIDVKITPKVPITSLSATPAERARTIAITAVQKAAATAQSGTNGGGRSAAWTGGAWLTMAWAMRHQYGA